MILVMFPSKKKKTKKKKEKRTENMLTFATLKKREKIMLIYPNDAKYYAGIIYKGLHLKYKR